LGIPTVVDRLVQQAILQVLNPLFDPTFSESSYGFRPGRSAHQALWKAQEYVAEGRTIVVDVDLEKFFDRVDHDVLMSRLARRVSDKRLLRIVRRFLEAGMLKHGAFVDRDEGTPQGGPLSPLLGNLLLDELDQELERRGHRFCRYADDCNIYVQSHAAGERVMASVTRFLEERLRLRVNSAKSAVAHVSERKFLAHRLLSGGRLGISTAEPEARQGSDPGDHAPQPGREHPPDDLGAELVPDGVGDLLPLCQREDAPATAGRVDTEETALHAVETAQAGPLDHELPGRPRCAAQAGSESGREWTRVVAHGRKPPGQRSHVPAVV
jgi:hypothetical protein